MTILYRAELVQRAGVDPWALHAKIAVGDPAQVEGLAAAFYKAGGNMAQSNTDQKRSADYRSEGYTTGGTSPVDFDKEAQSTVAAPENLQQIGKILDGVAGDLSAAMKTAGDQVGALERELASIDTQWTTFMQQIGHHLPPDDREATMEEYINEAVGKVKSRGGTIDTAIKKYEETIYGAQKSMSDLGYVPPATLDDLYGDGADYVKQLQQKARDEAHKLLNGGSDANTIHQVAGDITPYLDDPYFASAFYGTLGPQASQALPATIGDSGSGTAAADIKAFSHMFGTAVTNQTDDPKMQAVSDVFLHDPGNAPAAWDRAVMCSNGDFPPDWLATAARANGLDDFAKYGDHGFGGRMGFDGAPAGPFAGDIGMSTDVVGVWSQDLGRNPVAAREALATMGNGDPSDVHITGDPTEAYQTNIHKLIDYGHFTTSGVAHDNAGVARGYGAMFEAATGADDEQDGAHSDAAATFAKALFEDMHRDADHVNPVAAQSFAKIGGSYVQEMAAGAAADNDLQGPLPGQHPAFGVSGDEAREFMKTFVGDADATKTFDDAAGRAYHDAMVAAARVDAGLPAADAHNLDHVAHAYGTVAGDENAMTREVVGERDESAERQSELIRNVISAGVDLIPGEKVAEQIPGTVWDIAKHMTNMGLEQAYGATADPRFDATTDASHAIAVTNAYQQLSILHEAHYPGTEQVPADLIDPKTGDMLPAGKVLDDPQLRSSLHDYLGHLAQQHGANTNSVYDTVNNAGNNYLGGFDYANG